MNAITPIEAEASKSEQALVPITQNNIAEVLESSPVRILLDEGSEEVLFAHIRSEVAEFKADVSTLAGRKRIKAFVTKIVSTKTAIDKAGLDLTSSWRDKTAAVNASRKSVTEEMDIIRDAVRKPLTEWEDADKKRTEECRELVSNLKQIGVVGINDTAADVKARLQGLENTKLDEVHLDDFFDIALDAKDASTRTLKDALVRIEREERDREELNKLRKEAAERDRVERERLAKEAEEATRLAEEKRLKDEAETQEKKRTEDEAKALELAEQLRKEAAEQVRREVEEKAVKDAEDRQRAHDEDLRKAEKEKQDLIDEQARKDALATAEKARIEEEERARAADTANRRRVLAAMSDAINEQLDVGVDVADKLALLIVSGGVPHTKVEF